jgi:hypothetical protein
LGEPSSGIGAKLHQSADRERWKRAAAEWTEWARKSGHDAFWSNREAFAELVGKGTGAALDIAASRGVFHGNCKRRAAG